MKRQVRFATFGLALALTLVAGAFAQESSSRRAGATLPAKVPVTVVDENRKAIQIETLPAEAQAQVERIRTAAQGLLDQSGPGAQRLKIRVRVGCSWPPLRCTIEIEF